MIRLALLLIVLFSAARAERVVLGLSQQEVAITTRFEGSEILIFGAVKRDQPAAADPPLEVIVTVAGPEAPVDVRRKSRRFGIWVNTDSVHISRAPSFYAVASTAPLEDVLSYTENLRYGITINRAVRTTGISDDAPDAPLFVDAFIRIRKEQDQFREMGGGVNLEEATLFSTKIQLPANLLEGGYPTRIFLSRGGEIVDSYATVIDVRKVGLERWLFTLAHEKPWHYGVLSLIIAIVAGWGASTIFRLFQR
ncbi:TIGR02186 family protein [Qingshengfaniella alkalisoli]|uniref:Transmembrane protein (Alph_Pro_TM) n=1 Tax=Qingshengfaniella alkalisoli TaxID=2599296 RepID=A0A5B8I569_9RHOB|nr:TIGR02186 family protein [Qingshengfaniella alkalisoli]QDY68409.1 hypothetical protein FPZ52_01420 [Qingshengfaniella alkalisoli]